MPIAGIKLLIIGPAIQLPYECKVISDSAAILPTIAQFQPDVIMTTAFIPGSLNSATFELRKRWIHVPANTSPEAARQAVENCYLSNIWAVHQYQAANPLISVYTGTYNTGDYLRDTYQSLRDQTYANWEWVVIDDHSNDGTWERLEALAKDDIRVRPYRSGKRLEKIGAVKDQATRLSKGVYLVELDHDDMLTDFALADIRDAFEKNPEVGFVYSNSSNFFENGQFHRFDDEFWKNRYRETEYRGKKWLECLNPDIYDRFGPDFQQQFGWFLTVGPNHVRAFRAKTLFELGGYNPSLPVADDWDLYARFFLYSKCHHVDKMLYLYRFKDNWANTTFTRNKAIQDHLQLGRGNYAAAFKAFNEQRQRSASTGGGELLLTVIVPSIPSRMESLYGVLNDLFKQADGKPVEIVCLLDNRKSNLSEKRNQAIKNAKGRFISFVDDDDKIEPDYVDQILEAIKTNPKADCVVFDVLVHGYTPEPKLCAYGIEYEQGENETSYLRKPNHVMAYRTEISRKHEYRKDLSAISEDTEWAERASKDIQSQARISKTLYHYFYNPKTTTQLMPAPGQRTLKDVSFIVLEAAETALTKRCIQSIREHAPGSEVVYVSNGVISCPDRKADVQVDFNVNLGFAAGCNAGAAAATRPILCFMNNDAAFVDDTPAKLLAGLSDANPITAPFSNKAKPPQGDIPRAAVPKTDVFPDMVVGLCMMIPKALFQELDGFDPDLLTYEDDEFCRKAAIKGFKPKVVANTWVDHERHETFKKLGLDVDKVMAKNALIYRKKNPVIRVIVIAKDEEKALPGFFKQFEQITRDWCVLDTGSKDRTEILAKDLGCRVEKGPFEDFASARNDAVSRFGAGADWIIMIDPDERLDEHTLKHLKELLYRTTDDILYSMLQAKYPDGSIRRFVSKPFIWRNKPEIKWVFKVHEKLIGSKHQAVVVNSMNTHLIELHEDGRRQAASGFYDALMKAEPYFTDPAYKRKMIEEWPILDYDRMEDPRIRAIYAGPLVSVVIPTYKRAELLNRAISSALAQDYANIEVIVVGDKCPDLAELIPLGPPPDRVRLFNLVHNHGAGGAVPRNHAIAAAGGSLIAYLDDDNVWKSDHVSSLYTAMMENGASFAFSSMEVNGTDLKFSEPKHGSIDTSCILHRKNLVEKYGGWKDRTKANYYHDWEFVSRWVNGSERWVATRKPTLIYNAETCGQREFLEALALSKASK